MAEEMEIKYLIAEKNEDHSTPHLKSLYPSVESLVEDAVKEGEFIRQGYVPLEKGREIAAGMGMEYDFIPKEARLRQKGDRHYYALKGEGGLSRNESELEITQEVFKRCWPLTAGKQVSKIRFERFYQGFMAEIDVYTDRELIVAEIELLSRDAAKKIKPLGKDITEDMSYKNSNLAR